MKVYKFGGASLADSMGFIMVKNILQKEPEPLCIIVSALGKTTNALEKVSHSFYYQSNDLAENFENVKNIHYKLAEQLFPTNDPIFEELDNGFLEIEWVIEETPHTGYDFIYDQIVSIGEILSSKLLSYYLNNHGILNLWMDSRDFIQTDNTYRNAVVDFPTSRKLIENKLVKELKSKSVILQGFIGGTSENYTSTLGREGSDYSASIFASILKSDSLTVWKDVPGIMNSDPKINPDALFIPELSYNELAELSYYGASIIHPKTLKPLLETEIPLWVRSFYHPEKPGTLVSKKQVKISIPSYILKTNQMLISLNSLDGGFILEDHLTRIYALFASGGIAINLAVNSALSFSVLIDQTRYQESITKLIDSISENWMIKFNQNLNLLTIRYDGFSPLNWDPYIKDQEIIIEINTRHTLQKVCRNKSLV